MSRSLLILVVAVALLAVGVFVLSGRSVEQEPSQIEQVVPLDNLAN